MNWFYALNNQQTGPVDDDELVRLVQAGVISGTTLVWHSGLPDWQPYEAVRLAVALPPGATTSAGGAMAQPFAGFGIRLGAAFLDGIILMPVVIVIYVGYFILLGNGFAPPGNHSGVPDLGLLVAAQARGTIFGLGFALVQGAYSAWCLSRWGGTPGKYICELRVVRGNGEPLTFWRGYARFGAKTLCRLVPVLGIVVDSVFIFSDPQRRALHDQMCDTRVIYQGKKG